MDQLLSKDDVSITYICDAHYFKAQLLYKLKSFNESYLEFEEVYRLIEKINEEAYINNVDNILDCYKKAGHEEEGYKWAKYKTVKKKRCMQR